MRRTEAAEWILSLLTSQNHAASIAGDLAEQAPMRGALWFWGNLIRTAASFTWRAFADEPLRMTGMAFLGLLLQTVCMIPVMIWIVLGHLAVVSALRLPFETFASVYRSPLSRSSMDWQALQSAAAFFVTAFFLGKWLVRRAPQRELAVYLGTWVIAHLFLIPILMLSAEPRHWVSAPDWIADVFATIVGTMCTFAGIRRARRRLSAA